MKRRELTRAEKYAAERVEAMWRDRCDSLNLTREAAMTSMGVTRQAIWQQITGRMPIGFEACIRWAEVLQCDPAEIRPDLIERFDAVVRLRAKAATGKSGASPAHIGLLRACIASAFEEARQTDRYPTAELISALAVDLYTSASQPASIELERGPTQTGTQP